MIGVDIQPVDCKISRTGKNFHRYIVLLDDKCLLMRLPVVSAPDDCGIPGSGIFEFLFKDIFWTVLSIRRNMRSAIVEDHSYPAARCESQEFFGNIRLIEVIAENIDAGCGIGRDFIERLEQQIMGLPTHPFILVVIGIFLPADGLQFLGIDAAGLGRVE